jgi:hypothetical protein
MGTPVAAPTNLFIPSRLKIERAKHHINDLNTRLAEFLAKNPFETVVREDPDRAERIIRIKTNRSIPDEFSLIIGDAVHNLRSALDLATFCVVGAKAEQPEKVQFPFAREAKDFKSVFNNRQVNRAGKNIQDAIRNLQPYGSGNDLLYGLHTLDLADKHKLIVPVATTAEIVADDLERLDPAFRGWKGEGRLRSRNPETDVLFIIKLEGPKPPLRMIRVVEEKTEFQPIFSISFGPGQPFQGQWVVDVLVRITAEVTRAVDAIEAGAKADGIYRRLQALCYVTIRRLLDHDGESEEGEGGVHSGHA